MKSLIKFIKQDSFFFIVFAGILYLLVYFFNSFWYRYFYFYEKIKPIILILAILYIIFYYFIEIKLTKFTFLKNVIKSLKLNNKFYLNKSLIPKNLLIFFILIFLFFIFCISILYETSNYPLAFVLKSGNNNFEKFFSYFKIQNNIKNIGKLNNIYDLNTDNLKNIYFIIKINSNLKGYFQKNYYTANIIGICSFDYKSYLDSNLNNYNSNDFKIGNFKNIKIKPENQSIFLNRKNIKNKYSYIKFLKFFNKKIEKKIYINGDNLLKKGDIFIINDYDDIISNYYINFDYLNFKSHIVFLLKRNNNLFYKIRNSLFNILNNNLNKWNASFLYSLLTGDRRYINSYLYNLYQTNQTSHLLALSGLHIGIIVNFLFFILKRFIYNKKLIYFIIAFFIIAFGFFTEFPYSVIRAIIMFLLIIFILFSERKLEPSKFLFSLIFFGFLLIGNQISSISFILSISAIYSIFIIFNSFKKIYSKFLKFENIILDLFLVSFSITFFQSVIVLHFFKSFNFLSFLINPLVIIIVTLSVYSALLGLFIPILSKQFFVLSDILLDISHSVNIIFKSITKHLIVSCLNIDKYFMVIILVFVFLTLYIYFYIDRKVFEINNFKN